MLPELVARQAELLLREYCASAAQRRGAPELTLSFHREADGAILALRTAAGAERPLARVSYSGDLHQWFLWAPDAQRGWRRCLDVASGLDLSRLLRYLDQDPLHFFWPE